MYYCDKCSLLSDGTQCFACGAHNLRPVKEDDFCFVTEAEELFAKMFMESLKNEGIDCVPAPVGNGVRSALGLSLGRYRLYIPYRHYDAACEMLAFFESEDSFEDTLKEDILSCIDKWHFESGSTEKKLRKKYNLDKDVNIITFIKEAVQQAQSIEDVGLMSDGEHGLRVKSGNITLWFSGESFKISI